MKSSEILRAAHAALLECGWCQGRFRDGTGHLCLVGAIRYGQNNSIWDNPFPLDVIPVLAAVIGTEHLAGWNDHYTRTLPEVLAALEAAAAIAESQEHEAVTESVPEALAATV